MTVLPVFPPQAMYVIELADRTYRGSKAGVDFWQGVGSTSSIGSAIILVRNCGATVTDPVLHAKVLEVIAAEDAERAASDARRVELEQAHEQHEAKEHARKNWLEWPKE